MIFISLDCLNIFGGSLWATNVLPFEAFIWVCRPFRLPYEHEHEHEQRQSCFVTTSRIIYQNLLFLYHNSVKRLQTSQPLYIIFFITYIYFLLFEVYTPYTYNIYTCEGKMCCSPICGTTSVRLKYRTYTYLIQIYPCYNY